MKLLLRRADELEQRAGAAAAVGDFLTPAEQIAVAAGHPRCFFWGGYRGAERRAALFLPDWMEDMCAAAPAEEIAPLSPFGREADEKEAMVESLVSIGSDGGAVEDAITAIILRSSEFVTLTHRDWMGSVLALGLERRCIGDICVTSAHSALMFAHRRIGGYIVENLHRAGRDAVSAEIASPCSVTVPPREFEKISVTVASPRLDGVVKALGSVSREGAAEMIRRGEVQVNHVPEERCDRTVSPADVVCIRGMGKYIVDAYEGESRRGRLRISVRRYV